MHKMEISLTVNGQKYCMEADPAKSLADLLRDDLHLTGTKVSCGEGECGACTVLMEKKAVNSCLVPAAEADGCKITTIEGLGKDGKLDPVQQAFIDEGAVQCGFCTPGMVMSAKALLYENKKPNEEEIKTAMAGNLCRCTGYLSIIRAVKKAAETINTKS